MKIKLGLEIDWFSLMGTGELTRFSFLRFEYIGINERQTTESNSFRIIMGILGFSIVILFYS